MFQPPAGRSEVIRHPLPLAIRWPSRKVLLSTAVCSALASAPPRRRRVGHQRAVVVKNRIRVDGRSRAAGPASAITLRSCALSGASLPTVSAALALGAAGCGLHQRVAWPKP